MSSPELPLLEIRDLQVVFRTMLGNIEAVDGVNLVVNRGDSVGIVGESGSGKSVTALAVLGVVGVMGQVTRGQIMLNGKNILELSEREMRSIRGKEITMIFQEPMNALNPVYTVGQQLTDVIRLHTHLDKKKAVERATEVLTTVGLTDPKILDRYPHELSGGMAQRVMIAIAISCHSTLLIADEPTTALDVTIQSIILEEIRNLMKEFSLTLILITHDVSIAAEICNILAVMYLGEIVESGPLWDLLEKPAHPYTQGLLNAIPSLTRKELKTIEGSIPGPLDRPVGCRFHPRCPYVMEICKSVRPRRFEVSKSHVVTCHLYDGKSGGTTR